MDPEKNTLLRDREPIAISPKALQTLVVLLRNSREVVSKDELMRSVWPDSFVEEGNLSQNIFVLRKALGDTGDNRRYIITLPGQGYRFAADVRVVEAKDDVIIQSRSVSQVVVEETEVADPGDLPARDSGSTTTLIRKSALLIAPLLILLIGTAVVLHRTYRTAPTKQGLILIGGFSNTTANPTLEKGLRAALRLKLSESPYMDLVPEPQVQAALKKWGSASLSQLPSEATLTLCKDVGATEILGGAATSTPAGQYRVRLHVTDCRNGTVIAAEESVANDQEDVLAALGRAADTLRKRLGESEASIRRFNTPIAQATTNSLAALSSFAEGEERRAKGEDFETTSLYKTATDLDPNFALAYARLGIIYNNAQELETSRRYFTKAFELRDHASERERLYITAHYYAGTGETDRLLQVYQLWRELYPRDLVPANNLSAVYLDLGQPQNAVNIAREAVRLGPDNAFPYAALIRALRRTGQFTDAKEVYDHVVTENLDGIVAHIERYIIAFAENDEAEMQRQIQWSRGKPQEGEILNEAAVAAMGRGQLRRAKELFTDAAQAGLKNGLPQFAGTCFREYAEFASDVGMTAEARTSIEKALRSEPQSREFLASAALVFGNLSDFARAEQFADRAQSMNPADYSMTRIILPTARAAAYLHHDDPAAALRLLEAVGPYDLSWKVELSPIYYRGLAYLQLHRLPEARAQFRKVLDNRACRPEAAYIPLAHLGLARAYALEGKPTAAREEYEQLLHYWNDADPDLPVLQQAKSEYSKLQRP